MIFFEDFIKKLSETEFVLKKNEKFSIEIKKMVSVMGVGIALTIIAIYQGYLAYLKVGNVAVRGIFALVLLFLAFKQIKVVFGYKLSVDTEEKLLNFNKTVIKLDEIESCTLEERKVGKRLEAVMNIITKEKKQFIIPFYMSKKLRFAFVLKELLGSKFKVKAK